VAPYEEIFPVAGEEPDRQVSLECIHSRCPSSCSLLKGKDVLLGVIDVASDTVETPQEFVADDQQGARYVPGKHLFSCTTAAWRPWIGKSHRQAELLAAGAALAR